MHSHMVRGSPTVPASRDPVWPWTLVAASVLAAAGGCRRAPRAVGATLPPPAVGRAAGALAAHRCGDCHQAIEEEWRGSAHARAAVSPLFLAMRQAAEDATCDACHAPLAGVLSATDPVVAEGVTCDVCHTIRDVNDGEPPERFELWLSDTVKYGPLCDAQDQAFHRMGCSPLHEQSRLCSACHQYRRKLPGGGDVPAYTEFEEWRGSPAAARGQVCQDCHMPEFRAAATRDSADNRIRPHHGWLGANGRLRRRALEGRAEVEVSDERIRTKLTLVNRGAGHNVPTGSAERRLVVRVFTTDRAQRELGSSVREYGRFLVNAAGMPAPFFSADRVERDNRLRPNEDRAEVFEFPASAARWLRVEVVWWSCDPIDTARWREGACEHEVLLAGETSVARGAGRRAFRLRSPGPK